MNRASLSNGNVTFTDQANEHASRRDLPASNWTVPAPIAKESNDTRATRALRQGPSQRSNHVRVRRRTSSW